MKRVLGISALAMSLFAGSALADWDHRDRRGRDWDDGRYYRHHDRHYEHYRGYGEPRYFSPRVENYYYYPRPYYYTPPRVYYGYPETYNGSLDLHYRIPF